MILQKLSITLVFILLGLQNFYGQRSPINKPSKNVIYASVGTLLYTYSGNVGYDRFLTSSNWFFKSYYASIRTGGIATIDFSGASDGTGLTASAGITALTGERDHHFEVGLGLGYYFDTEVRNRNRDDSTLYPNAHMGYRLQKSKGFSLRTGVGFTEWAYIGLGYSF